MKKLFMILLASLALAACGGGQTTEATRDDSDEVENNSPEVTPQDNSRDGMDTTSTDMRGDTTKQGGTTGSTSGSGLDGSDMNGIEDESAGAAGGSAARQ